MNITPLLPIIISILFCIFLVIVITKMFKPLMGSTSSTRDFNLKTSNYSYKPRQHIMTDREESVFRILNEIFGEKCYVLPQVHLSKLFDHKIQGQNWRGAFAHINGKSVDFVLLRKSDFSPICAIEIDDQTHRLPDRKERDEIVDRLFASTNLPLVRFRSIEYLPKQEIVNQIAEAINKVDK